MDIEQLKKITSKASTLEKTGPLGMAKEFISIEDKLGNIETSFLELADGLKKKLDEELSYEVDEQKIVDSVLAKVELPKNGTDGVDGKDYVLTSADKKEIASSIKVPVIEKVIERTEVVKEQPIVTEVTNNVENPVTGEEIVSRVNDLPTDDDELKIDASHLKGLEKILDVVKGKLVVGGTKFLSYLWGDVAIVNPTDTQVLTYDATLGKWKNADATGGSSGLTHPQVMSRISIGF